MGRFQISREPRLRSIGDGALFSEQRAQVLFWRIFFSPERLRQAAMLVVEFSSHSPGVDVVRLVGLDLKLQLST